MPSFDDDDDRDLPGSQDGSSDDDADETMRDVDDVEGEGDGDGELDGEADIDGDADGDGDDDEDADSRSGGSQPSDNEDASGDPDATNTQDLTQQNAADGTARDATIRSLVRPEMLTAATYDIVPTIAAPQSTSVNTICATSDMRWVFSGGSDGYIRKFNWVDSVNNKLALTVAQRHPFVDSVVKAGVLMTYWENWDVKSPLGGSQAASQVLSPVYSLACHSQALWLLSGTASGAIRLQSVRHDEGKEIALLQKHTSAVSVLSLSSDERSLLSGSWDKTVLDWDLETGKVRTTFAASAGQISSIESRPLSNVAVPAESGEQAMMNGTSTTKNQADSLPNGVHSRAQSQVPAEQPARGTPDSLFGGDGADDDDLFGDSAGGVITNGTDLPDAFGEEDDEMNRAIANGPVPEDLNEQIMADSSGQLQPVQPPIPEPAQKSSSDSAAVLNGIPNTSEQPLANGAVHDDEIEAVADSTDAEKAANAPLTSDSTFMATSIDGAIRVWDRRQPTPVARILPRNSPPWCMSACWSPDGNYIFAGRRNNTVEEYDLRRGLRSPERVFRFPNGSGAVTSVKAMPNSRHLICASYDILRLYDLKESQSARSTVPFLIVPGHRTGVISQLYIDPSCRFMMSTGGNRGWEGSSTEVLLGYEIAASG